MSSTIDSTRVLRESARRAFLRGERQKAFDLHRCDPQAVTGQTRDEFETSFARLIVCGHAQEFAEAVMKSTCVKVGDIAVTPIDIHRALVSLERMESSDIIDLEYKLLRAGPHRLQADDVAEIVLHIMGRQ